MIKLALAGLLCAVILACHQIYLSRRRKRRRLQRRQRLRLAAARLRLWDELFGRWRRPRLPYHPGEPRD